ncbi:MAG: hypothetical protein WBA90_14345 [Albidovulum sp.]
MTMSDTRLDRKFELVDQTWRVCVPQLRLSRVVRVLAVIGFLLGMMVLFAVLVPLGFAVKTGNEQALELMSLLILLMVLGGQHFVFRLILPDQYRIGESKHFAQTSKLFFVYWVAYAVIFSFVLRNLVGGT